MRFDLKVLFISLIFCLIHSSNPYAQNDFADIFSEIEKKGKAIVIVEFKITNNTQNLNSSKSINPNQQNTEMKAAIAAKNKELSKSLAKQGISMQKTYSNLPYFITTVKKSSLERLIRHPDIKSISLNKIYRSNSRFLKKIPLNNNTSQQNNEKDGKMLDETVSFINADKLWEQGITGTGQVIVILDDGIDSSHDMFLNNIVEEACFSDTFNNTDESLCPNGKESQTGSGSASNCIPGTAVCEHGTHVAGTAAGNDTIGSVTRRGVSYNSDLLPIQVFTTFNNTEDCDGADSCQLSYTSSQLAALNYVIDKTSTLQIAAVNMSLGGGLFDDFCDNNSRKWAIDELRTKGVLTAIASGNESQVGSVSSPGCISTALTVSSVIISEPDEDVNHASMVDLLAPGVAVVSAIPNNRYAAFSGTSMATPHVAGAIALLKSARPNVTVDIIENALKSSGIEKTLDSWVWSTPLIDVSAAFDSLDTNQNNPSGRVIAYVSPSSDTSSKSLIRFHNKDNTEGSVTIQVMNDQDGSLLGEYKNTIPSGATIQVSANKIESDALSGETLSSSQASTLSLFVTSNFTGFLQHIRWDPTGASLANLSTCDNGLSNDVNNMIGVHTTQLAAFPSYIVVHNTGESDDKPVFSVSDGRDGTDLGSFTLSDDILPNTSVTFYASDLIEFFGDRPESDQLHLNVKLGNDFTGFAQHIINNKDSGLISNMTPKCKL